jgi:hypothetical protein
MREEAASAGFYDSPWGKHPRIQLLTVGEVLEGKGIDYPRTAGTNVTLKAAPRVREQVIATGDLFDEADDEPPPRKKATRQKKRR